MYRLRTLLVSVLSVVTFDALDAQTVRDAPSGQEADVGGVYMSPVDHRRGRADAWDDLSGVVVEHVVFLSADTTYVFETRNASDGADPVLHLLDWKANLSGNTDARQVAVDDNGGGGRNARLSFKPETAGNFILVLRARSSGTGGSADVFRGDDRIVQNAQFGGFMRTLPNLRGHELVETVSLPHGPGKVPKLYIVDSNGIDLTDRVRADASRHAQFRVESDIGTRTALVAINWGERLGQVRLVRNDFAMAAHDQDGDGLGDELEQVIGTCSQLSGIADGFACDRAYDARDTDGDGISDGLEFLGRFDTAPYQRLPEWGADPRHKDIFVEVDFMRRSDADTDERMFPSTAREMAAAYSESDTDLGPLHALFHAQQLVNPDLLPGIDLHLDIGVDPPSGAPSEDATIYGDWGGHNAVDPVCDDGECVGAAAADVWDDEMNSNRRGIFHYALVYNDGGASTPFHKVYSTWNQRDSGNAAHEFGHSLGIGHAGPAGGQPIDANCKPNYPSLMSYAYLHTGYRRFSDGADRAGLNNIALTEINAISQPQSPIGQAYLTDLRTRFRYIVDMNTGGVDWNRDGGFSSGTVRAYANNNGSGCEYTKYNTMTVYGSNTYRTPAVSRLDGQTIIFYVTPDDRLRMAVTGSDFDCPVPQPEGCFGSWSLRYVDEPWNRRIEAVDVHRILDAGAEKLLVVLRKDDNQLYEAIMTSPANFTSPQVLETIAPAIDEHSLTGDLDHVWMIYKGYGGFPMLKLRDNSTGTWTEDQIVFQENGTVVPRIAEGSSPALIEVIGPGDPNSTANVPRRVLYGIFPEDFEDANGNQVQGKMSLWKLNFDTGRWIKTGLLSSQEKTIGKPALAYVPLPGDGLLEERLHLFYLRRDNGSHTTVRERSLIVEERGGTRSVVLGLQSDHQNTWFYAHGVDLIFEPDTDENLRAVVAQKIVKESESYRDGRIQFRPKADGIVDYTMRNWSDWEVMAVDICRTLVASSSSNNLSCPDWQW